MFGLIENITTKDTPQGAARILSAMFETCVDRVDAMTNVLDDALERLERAKAGDESAPPALQIERTRPVAAAVFAVEKPEDVIHGGWLCSSSKIKLISLQSADCYSARFCTVFEYALLA